MSDEALRDHLVRLLTWEDAHVSYDAAVKDLAPELRGKKPDTAAYSPWQVLEHLRLTQWDILDFCRNPDYQEREWPKDYWPEAADPPNAGAWDESVRSYQRDRGEMVKIANDKSIDLFAKIPHGSGQTYLREILLVADHNAYHVGGLVVLRRQLGAWPG